MRKSGPNYVGLTIVLVILFVCPLAFYALRTGDWASAAALLVGFAISVVYMIRRHGDRAS
jgi:CHASE2 domain-containing sensor protein